MNTLNVIPLTDIRIGDRVRWSVGGSLNFGRVTKVNKKTYMVRGEKYDTEQMYLVSKELVFEALR